MTEFAAIRPMTRNDIPAVATLEQQIYDSPWSVRVFYDELAMDSRRYLVAEQEGVGIVGYAGLLVVESDAHITTLAVETQARRHSLGTRLMMDLIAAAIESGVDHITLEVRMSNEGAQRLYQKFGFAPVGLRKDYYRDEDALVMWANDITGVDYQSRLMGVRNDLVVAGHV